MASKNITIRVPEDEFSLIDSAAAEKQVSRTEFIRTAIHKYISNLSNPAPSESTIQEASKKVVKTVRRKIDIADFKHPLLSEVQTKGIAINGPDGNRIRTIHNLTELLDFVQKKVLQ